MAPHRTRTGSDENLILVGKISKAHGIRGEIKVYPYGGEPASILSCSGYLLTAPDGRGSDWYEVGRGRSQGRFAIISLTGVSDRDSAEGLAGWELWADRSELPDPDDDEFYWQDVMGFTVRTVDGADVGRVHHLFTTGAHDILVVTGDGGEYLIPVVEEILIEVNDEEGLVVIDPPPGLLEINE